MEINPYKLAILKYWIHEREVIRIQKERGDPKPWTDDDLLQRYRFTNVHREDDRVTRWLKENWRDPYDGHPNMTLAMVEARMVNWIPTLEVLGFPEVWDPVEFASIIRGLKEGGHKVWTAAYMVTAERDGAPKEVSVAKTISAVSTLDHERIGRSCKSAWNELQNLPRIGSFMAAQMVADLKHTHVLCYADDVGTFCAPGPGSVEGLNWLTDQPGKTWNVGEFMSAVNELRACLEFTGPMDAQDMQNCLCEIFKYQRGVSRSSYPGV